MIMLLRMMAMLLLSPAAAMPTTPRTGGITGALSSIERALFQADREREALLRRLRQTYEGDALSALPTTSYALPPGSSIAITGANEGIGLAAAHFLATNGYSTILCARTQAKADEAARAVSERTAGAKVVGVEIDQASMASVARGADAIRDASATLDSPLRGLLLNAGNWPTERRITADGLEEGTQVCHVSHWMLANDLSPDLCSSDEEARVVTVSSSAHALAPSVDLSDVSWERRPWSSTEAYGESKLANLLFARELAQRSRSSRLTSLAVHPGVVATSLFREFTPDASELPLPIEPSVLQDAFASLSSSPPLSLVLKTPADGCRTSCYALLAPGLPNGAYLCDCELTDVSNSAKDTRAAKELWDWTQQWVASSPNRDEG